MVIHPFPFIINIMKKLVIDNKELMLEWDLVKNAEIGLDPSLLSCGSNKTAHWKCHICGHEWTTRIERKNKGNRCQKCISKEYRVAPKEKSLATLYPDIAKEWDYELNDTTPDLVYPQSNLTYHWVCSLGHRWKNTAAHRCSRGDGCPYCSNKDVLEGYNDLKTTFPHLLNEWCYKENDKIQIYPTNVTYGSKKKVFWKCNRGHVWRCEVYRRTTYKEGCPECTKELRTSYPEKIISYYLSQLFEDLIENYRSKVLNNSELDMYIPSLNVGIEYDGSRWHKNIEKDKAKDILCREHGITLFRVREKGCPNYESESIKINVTYRNKTELSNAIEEILKNINSIYGLSKTIEIDIDRDSLNIISKTITSIKENSIANSPLIEDWDWDKNNGIDPLLIPVFSNRQFWWKCRFNHSWRVQVSHRSRGRNCPFCSGQKVLKGFNDLESQFPLVAKEWDYTKNNCKPSEVTSKSNKKYWWICSKCGHNWETPIYVRTGMGCGCPECKKKVLSKKASRKVINLDTNTIYESMKIAETKTGVSWACISCCCRGKTKTAGGYRWKYVD